MHHHVDSRTMPYGAKVVGGGPHSLLVAQRSLGDESRAADEPVYGSAREPDTGDALCADNGTHQQSLARQVDLIHEVEGTDHVDAFSDAWHGVRNLVDL